MAPDDAWRNEHETIMQAICKEAHRWETASFSGPEDLSTVLQFSIRHQLTHLQQLTIEIPCSDGDKPMEIFQDAPLLHTVYFNRDLWEHPVTLSLPWSQLRRYGGCSEWDTHLDALRKAPNLVDCSLEIQEWSSVAEDPVLLPHLRRLSLSSPHFLESLQTPALEELYCDYDALPVLSFLQQQTCKLQKLGMWECSTDPDPADLTRIVEALPTITRLALFFPPPCRICP
ncbi:F-box domain-containing protein [Mycena sanguinolenta]|uniref:F-box domain-containing protein n=1 Tax=Mycena sanguinolenta TaxID=230812 RepID=A0A8H7DCC4_9AGAR|nr:F-box domain-containing protein [Mycena sanguinolenta]